MGNQLSRDYDIGKQVASGGPGNLWRIHSAVKRSNGQAVSVFIFERKSLDGAQSDSEPVPKKYHDRVFEILKKEAAQLAKLRHPSLLEIIEPLDESRTILAFVTEPILASLANVVGNRRNLPLTSSPAELSSLELDELEIQKGILQVSKGLSFCHNDAKLVHGNLTPESIYLNAKGDWKISGFGFSSSLANALGAGTPTGPFIKVDYDFDVPACARQNLDYVAPEVVLEKKLVPSSDIYSLGCIIYCCFNSGRAPFNHRNMNNFANTMNSEQIRTLPLSTIPLQMQDLLRSMIMRDTTRVSAVEVQASKYFDNILVHTFKFLETLCEKPQAQKVQFLQGITRVLPQFPDRILLRKFLPILLEETKDHSLVPYLIPNIIVICEKMESREFSIKVAAQLKALFAIKEPVQVQLSLLQEVDFFVKKVANDEIKDFILPLLTNSLESEFQVVQEKCLKAVPACLDFLDYTTIKNGIFPRILTIYGSCDTLSIRVNALICFHAILKIIDKFTMTEKLIPLLKSNKSKEPAILMAMLGVYDEMGRKYLDKEAIALEIIPELWRSAIEPVLNTNQFKKFMKVIRDLGKKIEEQTIAHLEAIKAADEGVKAIVPSTSPSGTATASSDFESLVSGGNSNNKMDIMPTMPMVPFAASASVPTSTNNTNATKTSLPLVPGGGGSSTTTNGGSNNNAISNSTNPADDDDGFEPFQFAMAAAKPVATTANTSTSSYSFAPTVPPVSNATISAAPSVPLLPPPPSTTSVTQPAPQQLQQPAFSSLSLPSSSNGLSSFSSLPTTQQQQNAFFNAAGSPWSPTATSTSAGQLMQPFQSSIPPSQPAPLAQPAMQSFQPFQSQQTILPQQSMQPFQSFQSSTNAFSNTSSSSTSNAFSGMGSARGSKSNNLKEFDPFS